MGYRSKKRKIIEHRPGHKFNPLPAGPFELSHYSKFTVFHERKRYRGSRELIAYRNDNKPKASLKEDHVDYARIIQWAPHHELMISNIAQSELETVNGKWFKSSLNNADFDQIKENYVLFESFKNCAD